MFILHHPDVNMHIQTCAEYLRLLFCDKNEGIVVNEITVDVLSEGYIKRLCYGNNMKRKMEVDLM